MCFLVVVRYIGWIRSRANRRELTSKFEVRTRKWRNPLPNQRRLSFVLITCFPLLDYGTFFTGHVKSIPAVELQKPDSRHKEMILPTLIAFRNAKNFCGPFLPNPIELALRVSVLKVLFWKFILVPKNPNRGQYCKKYVESHNNYSSAWSFAYQLLPAVNPPEKSIRVQ